jgi:hypothetical protein
MRGLYKFAFLRLLLGPQSRLLPKWLTPVLTIRARLGWVEDSYSESCTEGNNS